MVGNKPTSEQIKKFVMLIDLFYSTLREIKELSTKKQDLQVNKFKINKINRILTELKVILSLVPIASYLDTLSEDNMYTNSDLVLILSEYSEGIEDFTKTFKKKKKNQNGMLVEYWDTID